MIINYPQKKKSQKKERGYSVEYVACVQGTDISTVAWKDNKIVTLASSFVGELPKSQVSRYDKPHKRYVTIDRSNVVGEYNRHMGGVNLIDSIMGRYKIKLRSKRWQVRMFYHFLDLAISNAWLLYKRVYKTNNTNGPLLSSADFREEIGTVLCKMGIKAHVQRRSIEPDIQAKKRKGPAQFVPPAAVRQDQVGYWPVWVENISVASSLIALANHRPFVKSLELHYATTNKTIVLKRSIFHSGTHCSNVPVMAHSLYFYFVR
ncbi:unnamed protein product [Parnassius apollo]|uniref:(apollo) hypothetical protein n=1 Tax=Parnassius apollo TaxID=110799 RepID=A0A8S3WZ07_PARAO|nr:unnamed protein product [Parnassius apollo]